VARSQTLEGALPNHEGSFFYQNNYGAEKTSVILALDSNLLQATAPETM
jgi:hypothetical protein